MKNLIKTDPVAKFYYKGSHSHPVRRTILILEITPKVITGYEIREGKTLRNFNKAKIKSYSRSKIAKFGDYSRLKMNKQFAKKPNKATTLTRLSYQELLQTGL